MLSAENNCTPKFKTLQIWSTEMRDMGLKLRYYHRYLFYHENRNITIDTLLRLSKQAQINFEHLTKEKVQEKLKSTKIFLMQIKKNHEQHQTLHLQQLAREYTEDGNKSAQSIINTIIERERLQRTQPY